MFLEMIINLTSHTLKFSLNNLEHRFSIHYSNLNVDNIFVNEDFNIIYIIN